MESSPAPRRVVVHPVERILLCDGTNKYDLAVGRPISAPPESGVRQPTRRNQASRLPRWSGSSARTASDSRYRSTAALSSTGLSVESAIGIVDQSRLPRFEAHTNNDNYVDFGTWTNLGLNNNDKNDQGAFDDGRNRLVAPVALSLLPLGHDAALHGQREHPEWAGCSC